MRSSREVWSWDVTVRSAAWLLATQCRQRLLKTLCRRKHEPEKANEGMKRVPVERQCIFRDAPCLQLFCHALILLPPAGNRCPHGSCLGSSGKDLGSGQCSVLGVPEGWQPLAPAGWQSPESSVRSDLQPNTPALNPPFLPPATTVLWLAATVENEKHHFYIFKSV